MWRRSRMGSICPSCGAVNMADSLYCHEVLVRPVARKSVW